MELIVVTDVYTSFVGIYLDRKRISMRVGSYMKLFAQRDAGCSS